MSLTTFFAVAGAALLLGLLLDHARLVRALRPRAFPPRRGTYPSVTVIRPIRGLDVGAAENVEAAFAHGYPGPVEILFVFDDAGEPAVPLVRSAIARHAAAGHPPGEARIVFCGPPPPGRTGKLNAMLAGVREARGDLLAFVDSDVRPAPGALRLLVDTLQSASDAGAAFAPVVVTEAPQTVGDTAYALLLNGLYGPAVEASLERGGGSLPFIMGQFMVLRRPAVAAIGGLEAAAGQLVDDMYLGARLHAAGWRNMVAPRAVPVIQRGLALRSFLQLYVRWITFSRTGLAGRSVRVQNIVRALVFWLGLSTAIAAAAFQAWLGVALLLAAAVGVASSINRLYERSAGLRLPPRLRWVAFALLSSAPAIYAATLTQRRVAWRGRTYGLDDHARLDATAPAAADQSSRT
jgi:ceramide glucosyltransferase